MTRRTLPIGIQTFREIRASALRFSRLLQANDFACLEQLFRAFYAYFASLGLDLTTEESSNAGRLDMALRFNNQVSPFVFEVVELSPEGRALAQIK